MTVIDNHIPLVVDLDGTVINTDLLYESVLNLVRHRPWDLLYLPVWLNYGKAKMKAKLANVTYVPVDTLPFNNNFIEYLRNQKILVITLFLT